VSDFDESWVHPAPLLKVVSGSRPLSDTFSRPRSLAHRFRDEVFRVLTWSLAFALVFATTFFVTKTVNDSAYRTRTIAALASLWQRALSRETQVEVKPPVVLELGTPKKAHPERQSPALPVETPAAGPSPKVLRLEELPLAPAQAQPSERSKKVRVKRWRAKKPQVLKPQAPIAPTASVAPAAITVILEEE
jgi:hypothetical protein